MISFFKLYESFLKLNQKLILEDNKERSDKLVENFEKYLKTNKTSLSLIELYNELKESFVYLNSKDKIDYILEYFENKKIDKREFSKQGENFIGFLKESNIYIKNTDNIINQNTDNIIDIFENYLVGKRLDNKIRFINKLNKIVDSNTKLFEDKLKEETNKPLLPYKELIEKYIFSSGSLVQFKEDSKNLLEKKLAEYKDNTELVETVNRCLEYKNKVLESNDIEKVLEGTIYLFKIFENIDNFKNMEIK